MNNSRAKWFGKASLLLDWVNDHHILVGDNNDYWCRKAGGIGEERW